nr:argininosuccinate synthase [Ktedonobacterales bacterium]
HQALESVTLSRDQARLKEMLCGEYARLIYNGQWYSALHANLMAFMQSTQQFVSGEVRLKLGHGNCTVVGRRSPHSLYQHALATYDRGDAFDHDSALGFIKLWGLPLQTQARVQLLTGLGSTELPAQPIFDALRDATTVAQ